MFIDSHCHLNMLELSNYNNDLDSVINACLESTLSHLLNISVNFKNHFQVIDIASQYSFVSASAGVHPCYLDSGLPDVNVLQKQLDHEKVVAVGETGLDYHYVKEAVGQAVQKESFDMHLSLAKEQAYPVIVHTRNAAEDTLLAIESVKSDSAGVIHCFTEDWDFAKRALDAGYMISFSGIVTFKNATQIQEVAKKVPLDRFLIETDSPYLAPVPFRGKPNFPFHVVEVAKFIADLRGETLDNIAHQSTDNFKRLFPKAKVEVV